MNFLIFPYIALRIKNGAFVYRKHAVCCNVTSSKIVIALQKLSVSGNIIEHKPFACSDWLI
jgi:hypothetical protein